MAQEIEYLGRARPGRPTVLLVGTFEGGLYGHLRSAGFGLLLGRDPGEVIRTAGGNEERVVLCSLYMGGHNYSGLEVLDAYRSKAPEVPVIISTHERRPSVVVDAMRRGAFDYVNEPFSSYEYVTEVIERAGEAFAAVERSAGLRRALKEASFQGRFVTRVPELREVLADLARIASSRASVLIEGESGTGKGLVARMIHDASPRSGGPFVVFDCAAVAETLIETELFGHRKGAFTGAGADRTGLLRSASGGTLFVDEISSLPLYLQGSLLRVMEEGRFRPVGADREEVVDVRFITASNRSLMPLVGRGDFRQDLFYRLSALPVRLPPLRRRQADIPVLAQYFLQEAVRDAGKEVRGISGEAMAALVGYEWPGNVRELRNVVERAAILDRDGVVDVDDLPSGVSPPSSFKEAENPYVLPSAGEAPVNLTAAVEDLERRLIREALERHKGNVSAAARHLGLARTTLISKMKRMEIEG